MAKRSKETQIKKKIYRVHCSWLSRRTGLYKEQQKFLQTDSFMKSRIK